MIGVIGLSTAAEDGEERGHREGEAVHKPALRDTVGVREGRGKPVFLS